MMLHKLKRLALLESPSMQLTPIEALMLLPLFIAELNAVVPQMDVN